MTTTGGGIESKMLVISAVCGNEPATDVHHIFELTGRSWGGRTESECVSVLNKYGCADLPTL
jgi:hypothetical protein